MNEEIQRFWNERAVLGNISGTNDFMLKNLELQLLLKMIPAKSSILDIGCGNGETLIKLAQEKDCSGTGIDFSENLIKLAIGSSKSKGLRSKLNFHIVAIPDIGIELGKFNYVLTERCLINLESETLQHKAFLGIMSYVKSGGYCLMVESSVQGLERINGLRKILSLEPITIPWHNVFLDERHVRQWGTDRFILEKEVPFSSTYYFLSRAVYARLAQDKMEKLKYDSDINKIACELPNIGDFGPTRMWVWKKRR
ncbi:class I SAM-dependent methyltransferase [Candidatus Omnitrophota bacterium]